MEVHTNLRACQLLWPFARCYWILSKFQLKVRIHLNLCIIYMYSKFLSVHIFVLHGLECKVHFCMRIIPCRRTKFCMPSIFYRNILTAFVAPSSGCCKWNCSALPHGQPSKAAHTGRQTDRQTDNSPCKKCICCRWSLLADSEITKVFRCG